MRRYSSLHSKFKKRKSIISKSGEVTFNNLKSSMSSKNKKKSSQRWISRQINDPFTRAAKIEGYLARSAYKLIEIQNKYGIFTSKTRLVVDLGCSPGSWSQVVLTKWRRRGDIHVVGVDLLSMKFTHSNLHFIQGDFESRDIRERIVDKIVELASSTMIAKNNAENNDNTICRATDCFNDGDDLDDFALIEVSKGKSKDNKASGRRTSDELKAGVGYEAMTKVDCIICDIAPNSIGNSGIDRMRSENILETLMSFCDDYLTNNGNVVCKAIKGSDNFIYSRMREMFKNVYRFKPKSSHRDSSEMFLIGVGKIFRQEVKKQKVKDKERKTKREAKDEKRKKTKGERKRLS